MTDENARLEYLALQHSFDAQTKQFIAIVNGLLNRPREELIASIMDKPDAFIGTFRNTIQLLEDHRTDRLRFIEAEQNILDIIDSTPDPTND